MKSVTVFALKSERKRLIEYLQRQGTVDITRQETEKEEGFERVSTSASVTNFERNAATADKAIGIINEYAPKKGGLLSSLSGRRIITDEQYAEAVKKSTSVMPECHAVVNAAAKLTECAAERVRLNARIESVLPWESLDVSQQFSGTLKTEGCVGTLPKNRSEEEIAELLAGKNPELIFSVERISGNEEQTCIVVICPKAQKEDMTHALRELGFARPPQSTTKKPKEKLAELKRALEENDKRQEAFKQIIIEKAELLEDMELVSDYFNVRADKYRAIATLDQSKNTFVLKGYTPEENAAELKEYIESNFTAAVEISEPEGDDVPVAINVSVSGFL